MSKDVSFERMKNPDGSENPKYVLKEYQTEQLWGKKLQKSAKILFNDNEMKKVAREAREKSE